MGILSGYGYPTLQIPVSDHYDGDKFHNLNADNHQSKGYRKIKDFVKWRFTEDRSIWLEWVTIQKKNRSDFKSL